MNWLNQFLIAWGGFLNLAGFILNILILLAMLYYFKSERFHLWVQRWFLWFRRTYTHWLFQVSYTRKNALPCGFEENMISQLVEALASATGKSVVVQKQLANSVALSVDQGLMRVSLDLDANLYDVALSTNTVHLIYDPHNRP